MRESSSPSAQMLAQSPVARVIKQLNRWMKQRTSQIEASWLADKFYLRWESDHEVMTLVSCDCLTVFRGGQRGDPGGLKDRRGPGGERECLSHFLGKSRAGKMRGVRLDGQVLTVEAHYDLSFFLRIVTAIFPLEKYPPANTERWRLGLLLFLRQYLAV
jgi:hypothetical protein